MRPTDTIRLAGSVLPDFALEVYLGRHEFAVDHHLTASDAQTLTVGEMLAMATDDEREAFFALGLTYLPTWGTTLLRDAVASTYDHIGPDGVLCLAGAQEGMFWAFQQLLAPGDHAIVTVPNYQSMESVPIANGVEVVGLPLWRGVGTGLCWTVDLNLLEDLLRPNTRVVGVNFPNNPTGFVPDHETWRSLVELCDERGIVLVSDEVYRGIETDPARTLPQAADLSPRALSVNVMSKSYGLPGLRVGWLASQDRSLLERLERAKHYTSICNAGPSEALATIALRNGERIRARNRAIVRHNLGLVGEMFARYPDLVDWSPPIGGCVAFPRYLGDDGVEAFAASLIADQRAVVLPSSIYRSALADVPPDRFRFGVGRSGLEPGLVAFERHLTSRRS
ncbi:MAG: aminotransferase class I/II-fold pyridoxal phosphate-dependent enzyme [Dermatophilaceae bacterium]